MQGERISVSNSKACPGSHPTEGVVAGGCCCVSQDNSFSFELCLHKLCSKQINSGSETERREIFPLRKIKAVKAI